MFDKLGDRDYDSLELDEHWYLKNKIDKFGKCNDYIVISFIYNCLELLSKDVLKKLKENPNYDPNVDIGALPIFVLQKRTESLTACRIFVDHNDCVYSSWENYKQKLETIYSPACRNSNIILNKADATSSIVGFTSGTILLGAAIPALAIEPIAVMAATACGVGAGVYRIIQSGDKLVDRIVHKEVSKLYHILSNVFVPSLLKTMNIANSEACTTHLNIMAGTLSFAGVAENTTVFELASKGYNISRVEIEQENILRILKAFFKDKTDIILEKKFTQYTPSNNWSVKLLKYLFEFLSSKADDFENRCIREAIEILGKFVNNIVSGKNVLNTEKHRRAKRLRKMHCAPFTMFLCLFLTFVAFAYGEDDTVGPVFVREPPNRIDFSNTTGAVVECSARGHPPPEIIWLRSDGTAVGDVPGLRQVLANGNLVFPPFRAEDYRQEVHAQIYSCLAKNSVGSIHSKDVNVRAVVAQYYDTDVNKEYVIRGNAAILKCQIPSFVADFVSVVSWHTDQNEDFIAGGPDVVNQYYEAEVVSEYVIRGNTAVLKCNIPSFVADFVRVEAWVGSDNKEYTYISNFVVNQFYKAEILTEYVIRGNTAILKCSIPSFVADFVYVESWIDDSEKILKVSTDYVVSQFYITEAENEYVIRGNSAIMKCKIPSFVADFVQIDAWLDSDDKTLKYGDGNYVVAQSYEVEADNEYVIRGNSAVMKCEVPSFVSDFVNVENWQDSKGNTYLPGSDYVVNQYFEAQVYDVFVIKGNTAIFKCQIPSFVSDHVDVISWQDSDNNKYLPPNNAYVISQPYNANVMDESVLKGNTAIFKCHIPSFVSDYVQVTSWLQDDSHEIVPEDKQYDSKYLVLPSGELHIRDVGPEDGYKTYQCRTKHRLTGETRLSATKGRLVITEPIGSVKPAFQSADKINAIEFITLTSVALLCPAQAYPVPSQSVKPKFPTSDKSHTFESNELDNLTLLCPAQAYPVPSQR
ncbi:hypothetical protein FQA39_LY06668 [Lamprigera yunnana]|nr:hypothetical protein FQA39_LY06668 [Lamprigera yunnana]